MFADPMHLPLAYRQQFLISMLTVAISLLVACNSTDESIGTLTEPPGQDDEPIPEAIAFNNAVGFEVFREPHGRLPVPLKEPDAAALQEFEAGLPAPVISAPPGFDTNANNAPFFSNLKNLDVFAGDTVAIRFAPEDLDGDLPGMFYEQLPLGGAFPDNRDGSKTFRWQPLQQDVGIFRFTVVAVDAVAPGYRSSQTVLIRVSLPEDPSSIPNVAPMVESPREYTVRVNDPVVLELKGLDLNGTIPTLELPEPPVGASFVQHPVFEEVFVLKFTPTVAGEFTINVLARDSVDPNLTTTEPVNLNVLDSVDFQASGLPLRELAQNRDFKIGFAALQSFYHQPDGALYADFAAREFNIVTPENSMKMDTINPLPGRYEFAATDNLVRYAQLHDMQVHGHPLVWHRQLPEWIEQSELADREQHMSEYIQRIMERYSADIDVWDVINETVDDDGSLRGNESVWFEAMGELYIDKALQLARSIAPAATLLINEFDISMAGDKFNGLVQLVERLQARDVPLDGIGFQMHLFDNFSSFDELQDNFAVVAALGLDIFITELDVSISSGASQPSTTELALQADVYRQVAGICIQQPACKALQMWGFTDQYSFRSNFNPLPYDRSYQRKPAFQALQEILEISTPETGF
ncbi:MAG: endo-1,4-beta-xylanase [Granulosicoccus sp.]